VKASIGRVLLYIDHPGVEITQQEYNTALERAQRQVSSDSTGFASVVTETLRRMLLSGELSRSLVGW